MVYWKEWKFFILMTKKECYLYTNSFDSRRWKKFSADFQFFFPTTTVKNVCIEVALLISHKDEKTSLFSVDELKCVRKSSLTPVFEKKSAPKFFPMLTVNIVCIEVALLFSHKDGKTSLFSEDKLESVRKNSLTPVFKWKSALKFFPTMTVKTVCIEVALLISHKDEKFSLFSVDQLKCVRKSSLTPVFERKSALKIFPMVTVNIICIEVAHLFSHKDGKNSLLSEEKLECVRKNSLTPVFKWKSALKVFPMMTLKIVCIEVALLFSHKEEKTSLFSEDQLKSVRKSSLTPVFNWKSALKKTGVREFFLTHSNFSSERREFFPSLWLKRCATSIQIIFTVTIGKIFSADFLSKTGVRELFLTHFNWSTEKSENFSSLWLIRSATSIQTVLTVIVGKNFSADFHLFFPMVTVETVCLEVAHLLSHKDEKTSLFSEDQKKV